MKANIYDVQGNVVGEIELPEQFKEPVRLDLIKRAVLSIITARLQPKGSDPFAGKRAVVKYSGTHETGRKTSRTPRNARRRAVFAPHTVGGRRCFPPNPNKILLERINKNEKRMAIRSAMAATIVKELVIKRGHIVPEDLELPIIVDGIEQLSKTKDVRELLKKIKLWEDVEKAQKSKRNRSGKGKMRGRRYKQKKSLLIVYSGEKNIYYAARNLPGVDVVDVKDLNALVLAPGAQPGRLTIWSKKAIEELRDKKLFM